MPSSRAPAVEQDPKKFVAIIQELNQVLEEKERRLKKVQNPYGTDRQSLP
jgi:hypothetical protein